MSRIIGISSHYHDSAAALLVDGEIIAAAQEERFSRIKHDKSFPLESIKYVLREGQVDLGDIDILVYYEKPFLKFERLIETYMAFAPNGLSSFLEAIPIWIREKLFLRKEIESKLKKIFPSEKSPQVLFSEHHLSHAASAYFPSPFQSAAILTVDGVGEWATTTISHGHGNEIKILTEQNFPNSVGLLYSAFTHYCGFKVNSGEYKLMGLAPYGNLESNQFEKIKSLILEKFVKIFDDGSIHLNLDYFGFTTGLSMTVDKKWEREFGFPRRKPQDPITQNYMDMALAIQKITEEILVKLVNHAKKITGEDKIVLAGGVSLNCVANGGILKQSGSKGLWIQPAAGDAGGALGAAYVGHYLHNRSERIQPKQNSDQMKGSYLGPTFLPEQIKNTLKKVHAEFQLLDQEQIIDQTSTLIAGGKVVGWFQGRMEFGPRALGNRSILADPRNPDMQRKLNLKIKEREGFRPFAPSVLEEYANQYFNIQTASPYMLLVAQVNEDLCNWYPQNTTDWSLNDKLSFNRSKLPAITHIDYSARIQTVSKSTNSKYWHLIDAFRQKTGCPMIVNTSFNVRGEPIVCTPDEAYRCFMATDIDYLVLDNFLLKKEDQPDWQKKAFWKTEFELD